MTYDECIFHFTHASGKIEHEILLSIRHLSIDIFSAYEFYKSILRFPTAAEAQMIYSIGISNFIALHRIGVCIQ